MTDGDAGRCEPYRAEWRYNLTEHWCLLGTEATISEAEHVAAHALHEWGGQARVVEQRVVLVRGFGQDGGPDQAFIDWQKTPPKTRRHETERDALAHIASVREWLTDDEAERVAYLQDVARDAMRRSVVSDPDDRRDVEAAADDERAIGELPPCDVCGGDQRVFDGPGGQMWACDACEGYRWPPHVVDAWAKEAAARQTKDTGEQTTSPPIATTVDTAGCAHRMSSGAVSLTACGECGADPGDQCADALEQRITQVGQEGGEHIARNLRYALAWGASPASVHRTLDDFAVPRHAEPEQPSDEDATEAERVLDATEAEKIGGTSPLESFMRETSAEIDALLAEHGKPLVADLARGRVRLMARLYGDDPWWRRLLQRTRPGH